MDEELLIMANRSAELPVSRATSFAPLIAKAFVACAALLLLGALGAWIVDVSSSQPPDFTVTIDGFAGLDGRRVPRAFNLTLGIDNLGGTISEICLDGEAVVLYGGVPLAAGGVEERCAPRKGAADLAVAAASGGGVGVPGALAELMAGEARADGAVYVEVRVISPKHGWFLSCAAALDRGAPARRYPCKMSLLVDESDGVRPDGDSTPGWPC